MDMMSMPNKESTAANAAMEPDGMTTKCATLI